MRWPWVSRALYEAELARIDDLARVSDRMLMEMGAKHEAEITRYKASDERYADLLSKYHQLKVQGFSAPAPQPVIPTRPPVDPVVSAVNAACAGKDAAVRQAALKQIAIDRMAALSDDVIIARIRRGNRPMDDMMDPEPTPSSTPTSTPSADASSS
jgi:hypothetical protein